MATARRHRPTRRPTARLLLRLLYAYPTLTTHHRRRNAASVADLQARIRHFFTALGD
jgi:hypothetical protein